MGNEAMTTLYLVPWDATCDTRKELRCFVHGGTLTAISQYRWFDPSATFCTMSNAQLRQATRAVDEYLQRHVLPAFLAAGGTADFTMDVEYEEAAEGAVRLIELNCFGAQLAAGSCLFHWLRDHDELYVADGDGAAAPPPIHVRVVQP